MSKRYQGYFLLLIMLMLTVMGLSTVGAQDTLEEQPLMQMLARIPNTTMSRTEIYYNDRKAIEVAYPPAAMPQDFAEFVAMNDARGEDPDLLPLELWWKAWRNQSTAFTGRYLQLGTDTPAVVGFDYFQIEQEMTYGTPPAQTLQLAGNFNQDMVRAAFTVRGYTARDGAAELWCPEEGCDAGNRPNLPNRNPANLFGGELGRSQSLLIEEGALISSPDETVMNDHVDVVTGDEQSLADLPQYRAAAAAITADGSLLQAYFWDGELLLQMSQMSPISAMLGERATPELIKQFYEDLLKDFQELPPYQLLAFADVASDSKQIGEVALVYTTEEAAKTAAAVIPDRLDKYESIAVRRSLRELLTERRVEEPIISIVEHEGTYVVVIALQTDKATAEQFDQFDITSFEEPEVTPPGLVFKLLIDSAFRRDLGWLNTVPRSVIEEMAK